MNVHPDNILLTGRPGIGKTTVIMRLAERLAERAVAGFYTEEIRPGTHRQGFRAVTFSGHTALLAHISLKGSSRVGRYGVDVTAFENLVLPELARPADVMLIDEIGKMECFSTRFAMATRGLLDGVIPVVGTVASKGAGFIAEVKGRADIEICEVTRSNRDELPQSVAQRLAHTIRRPAL
jgi:nucleoside-triphosphatase